ncbi:hypothetical protein J1N35_028437 [Gossypium stocksii]|uniref:Uncharacterized protein n=1 Tax=Gossypium stocksii TaxID=47602 RepID=A0A9D3UW22_9ROSI|nr:hypothetical protein J1N35_028437 [Gossypium stocksii]
MTNLYNLSHSREVIWPNWTGPLLREIESPYPELVLKDRVVTLEKSVGGVKERIEDIDGKVNYGLLSMKEQLRYYVLDSVEKLTGRDDAIEAMLMSLKEEIAELKGELTIYKAALSNRGLANIAPKPNVDIPKPKEFKGTRSIDVRRGGTEIGSWEDLQCEFKAQFYQEYAKDEA